jgi:hypothetical protein
LIDHRDSRLALRFASLPLSAVLSVAVLACGAAPRPPGAPGLVLDVKFEQPDELATILGASPPLDGGVVARFQLSRPERAVVFSEQRRRAARLRPRGLSVARR